MGQSGEQGRIINVLQSSLEALARERTKEPGWSSVLVASDNFFAWVDSEPYVQVSPDVYMLDRASQGSLPKRWETWRPGQGPPRFVVEIVSSDWKKDYEINPARYDHLGVGELVLVDQDAFVRDLSANGREPLLVYRRDEDDKLKLVYHGRGPAYCAEIDAYLCFRECLPDGPRVRISYDSQGTDIVPTLGEQAAAAKERIAAAEDKAAAAEKEVAAAREELANQAAEIASLRARLRGNLARSPARE